MTDEFGEWYDELIDRDQDSIQQVVNILEQQGMDLGFPYSSRINGTAYAFRELRPKAGNSPLRVLYAFDPRRDAVLIIGGTKAEIYGKTLKTAEKVWEQYLEEQAAGPHRE